MTPASPARLGRDVATAGKVDLALYWAQVSDEEDPEQADARQIGLDFRHGIGS